MDRVCDNHDPVIIIRQKQQSVVMMSLDDFNVLEETAYLLRSPKNAESLDKAINDIRANKNLKKVVL
jgi:antitoxin YefM